jgi:hypothetical protein
MAQSLTVSGVSARKSSRNLPNRARGDVVSGHRVSTEKLSEAQQEEAAVAVAVMVLLLLHPSRVHPSQSGSEWGQSNVHVSVNATRCGLNQGSMESVE